MKWFKHLFHSDRPAGELSAEQSETALRREELATKAAPDLVDGINALAAYYRYLEAEAYDASLKSARDRRDFRDELVKRIGELLGYESDSSAHDQIQYEIDKEAKAFASFVSPERKAPASEARLADPKGYELLNLARELTPESLRTAYRQAAKKYHPDVGGDNATMQRVNDAYALFAAILRRSSAENDAGDTRIFRNSATVEQFFDGVRLKMFGLALDDLAADRAYELYQTLSLTDIEQAFHGVDSVAKLCKLMAAWKRKGQAERLQRDLETLAQRGKLRELNYGPIVRQTAEQCEDPGRIRFVPNHARQADNLLRLGIIDQKRYSMIMSRINTAEVEVSLGEASFVEFARSYKFLDLPIDPPGDSTPINGLVPAPGYYSRVETLTPAQSREYARAFHGDAAELALKYLPVRLDALLRAPFLGYRDLGAVVAEMKAIASCKGLNRGMKSLCNEGLAVASFLAQLPIVERQQRIELLKSIDGIPGQLSIIVAANGISGGFTRPIFLNPGYTKFATAPIERIKRYIETGDESTSSERNNERKQWQDSHAFRESDIYKRAQQATWAKVKNSEQIVDAVGALCEAMYQRASQGDVSLEIGYWTNDLTIHLVKLKRFKEALRWIDRLDTAPSEIQQRTPGSIAVALSKRRTRCVDALRDGAP